MLEITSSASNHSALALKKKPSHMGGFFLLHVPAVLSAYLKQGMRDFSQRTDFDGFH